MFQCVTLSPLFKVLLGEFSHSACIWLLIRVAINSEMWAYVGEVVLAFLLCTNPIPTHLKKFLRALQSAALSLWAYLVWVFWEYSSDSI